MSANKETIVQWIREKKTALGIEFGSTRIKAVLVGEDHTPIASGDHDWENRLTDGIWTYTLEDIWTGIQDAYAKLAADVKNQYGETLHAVGGIGISAMMHGYMVFDKAGELLVPFRTWRNTIRKTDGAVCVPDPAALEHCASVSGNFKWGSSCTGY